MPDQSETLTAIQAGQQLAKVITDHGGTPFVFTVGDSHLSSLEHLMPQPARKIGDVALDDLPSLIRFVNEHKTDGTAIFANVSPSGQVVFTAVIDYHSKSTPGWQKFKATYALQTTKEWQKWIGGGGRFHSQPEFALLLEDLQDYFKVPTGAELLELVLTLEGKKNARIESGIRLQNGQQRITYHEDIELKGSVGSQKGTIDVPQILKVTVPLFDYNTVWQSEARLRYKIDSGKLWFAYEIIQPHLIIRKAVDDMVKVIAAETKLTPFLGRP